VPLAFNTLNHGSVAFGFFNIDSDMLLLDRYFIFATEFCEYISSLDERHGKKALNISWHVYYIEDPEDIGDLMGAIHGVHYQGFIGEIYRQFPFPRRPEDFKQRPEGSKNRAIVEDLITRYAGHIKIPFTVDNKAQTIGIGIFKFSRTSFHELIKYVWRGGYPRWQDEVRPAYVLDMKKKIEQHKDVLFDGIYFED